MKTTFNDLWIPVKSGLYGYIWFESKESPNGSGNYKIKVIYHRPDTIKGDSSCPISLCMEREGMFKVYVFGKTRKEIKELQKYINDFRIDYTLVW